MACATPEIATLGGSPARLAAASDADVDAGPHPTIEAAVEAAFAHAERGGARATQRTRLRIGTIRRVADGFVWREPVASSSTVDAMSPMRVRLLLGPDDVALYGLHPRSGHADLDRLNESLSRDERQLVDLRDPLHRPLFVRTPSRRTIRYPEAGSPVELVRADGSEVR